ncbi:FCD domain-containing protein [Telmatospirillum siberiense]|uniref:Pyruvate dehydrogenase complex repressor n=1 Tax=Telmatospirillum siberiense TaxID=382514 RepID=A0A2N3PM14_9PROT|nr:FCD domain-containing protein [Telmatospirillum siberiense]PKU21426.1 GntR family transcriptional regulator [Telmatospirillum siberiense]
MYQPVKQGRRADAVADQLRQLIVEGTLRPGVRLPTERDLAERFQTSRPTIRDAVTRLEHDGLLSMQRDGMHVADPAAETIAQPLSALLMSDIRGVDDYMEFRHILEGSAAYLAALRSNEIDREHLRRCFETMVRLHEVGDPEAEAAADADFHLAIYEMSHNVVILHVLRALSDILRNDVLQNRNRLYLRQGYRQITLKQHRSIYDAIIGGAPEEARQSAQAHISFAKEAIAESRKAQERLDVSRRRAAAGDLK